jgi:hypothetical protein
MPNEFSGGGFGGGRVCVTMLPYRGFGLLDFSWRWPPPSRTTARVQDYVGS